MKIIDVVQGTPEWIKARVGIPTASNFNKIITPKNMKLSSQAKDYQHRLIAEWMTGEPIDNAFWNHWMERGTELEDKARLRYEIETGMDVQQVGFITNDAGTLGASPDGIVPDALRGLEIKCPSAEVHVSYMAKRDMDKYKCQVQGGIHVCELDKWDIVSFSETMPMVKIEVGRDEVFIKKMVPALTQFCDELAELKEAAKKSGWEAICSTK